MSTKILPGEYTVKASGITFDEANNIARMTFGDFPQYVDLMYTDYCSSRRLMGFNVKPSFWRNPMKWLKHKLRKWLLENDVELINTRLGNYSCKLDLLSQRLDEAEDAQETDFDDETLTRVFDMIEQVSNLNAAAGIETRERLYEWVDKIKAKLNCQRYELNRMKQAQQHALTTAKAHDAISMQHTDDIAHLASATAVHRAFTNDRVEQMDAELTDLVMSLCIEVKELRRRLDIAERRLAEHELLVQLKGGKKRKAGK